MMEFKLPDLGEGVHEGQILSIHVVEGQEITEDSPLLEVETDKAAVEIPSPCTGIVSTVHVREKQLVHVGDVMITFSTEATTTESPKTTPTPLQSPSKKHLKNTSKMNTELHRFRIESNIQMKPKNGPMEPKNT